MFSLELNFLKIVTLITALVVAGEALALLTGTTILADEKDPWAAKNMVFLILDIITGLGLVYFGLVKGSINNSVLFILLTLIVLATHSYREWQYFADVEYKFCFNIPLFVVNNLKLLGLVVISISGLILRS